MSSPEATLIGVLADTTGPHRTRTALAGQEGLEPPTTGFGDRDSSQLSYCPVAALPRQVLAVTAPYLRHAGMHRSPGGPPPVAEVYVAETPAVEPHRRLAARPASKS